MPKPHWSRETKVRLNHLPSQHGRLPSSDGLLAPILVVLCYHYSVTATSPKLQLMTQANCPPQSRLLVYTPVFGLPKTPLSGGLARAKVFLSHTKCINIDMTCTTKRAIQSQLTSGSMARFDHPFFCILCSSSSAILCSEALYAKSVDVHFLPSFTSLRSILW